MNNLVLIISAAVGIWCFAVAYFTFHLHRRGKRIRLLPGIGIGALFALSLTVFADALLNRIGGTSFYHLLSIGSVAPSVVFISGALQGVTYEYVGSVALGQWYYPTVHHKRKLLLLLPIFWALFMVIMQDMYAIFRVLGLSTEPAFVLTALIPFGLIEGINIYTRTWVYQRLLKSVPLLILGWFLLAYTFVFLFNAYVLNPFGY